MFVAFRTARTRRWHGGSYQGTSAAEISRNAARPRPRRAAPEPRATGKVLLALPLVILLAAVTVQRTLGSGSVAGARPATAIECRSAALGLGEKDRVETIAVLDGYRTLREAPGGDLLRAPWHATWEVQCSGPGGRYLGSLKWDADTGYLMGVSGIPAPHRVGGPEDARSGPLTGARSADAAAAAWLAALPPAGIVWRAASPPRRIGDYWECRLRADAGRGALLRLDIETGDLRQAIFSGPALPDWAAAARR